MLNRLQVSVLMVLVCVVYAALQIIDHQPLGKLTGLFSGSVTVLTMAALVFEKWGWKLPILGKMLGAPENIHGTWKAVMESDWVNPQTLQRHPTIEAYLVVRQSFSTVSVRMFSNESYSDTLVAKVDVEPNGFSRLVATFLNTPDQDVRGRSAMARGAFHLRIEGDPPHALSGDYWTERKANGTIKTTGHIPKMAHSFEHARKLFTEAEGNKG